MDMKDKLKYILFALSLVLIFLGIMRGQAYEVFLNAINICLECIGIG